MKADKLIALMDPTATWASAINPHAHLPRYAATCGCLTVPPMNRHDHRIYDADKIEIPDELVPKILALYAADRATNDLRALGEGMAKCSIPSHVTLDGGISVKIHQLIEQASLG